MPITFLDEEEEQIAPVTQTKRKITFLDEEEADVSPETPQAAQPTVTQPSQYKYDPARFRPKNLAAPKAEQEVGTLEGIANAAKNAFDSSRQALDIVGDVTPEEAQNIAKIEFDKQSRKVAPGYDEYQKAEGFNAVLAFAKNPIEVTSNIVAEGLAGSLPALGAGLAAGGVGAAAGSVVPVLGTGVGFTAGQVAGTFAGSLATEYGSKILEEMQSEGVDLTKPESIQGFFENEEAVAKARDKAISRGIPVAAFDAISAGIGGKLGRVFGKQFLTKTGEAAAELGVQAGLGGGGEVAGALAAGEPIEGKAVFGEIIGEAGPGAAEIITGRMADRAARVKAEEDAKIKAAAELSTNLEENSAPLTAAAVKSTTATTIEQDKLAAQLEEELDADEINKQVSGQLAVTKEPTAAPPAIQSKEEFAAIYSQVAPEELDAAEAGFTQQAATAATEDARANAQNALEAIKEVKATVAPPAPPVEPTITPAVQPAVPTAQPPITDATQEIIQPEGVRQEPQDRVEGQPPEEAGVSDRILGAARGEEEGQVVPTPTAEEPLAVPPAPAIPEAITRAIEERRPISAPFALQYGVDLPRGWRYEDDFFVPPAAPAAEVVAPVEPIIREVPEISPIVGAEPAAIVEQEPVAPAEPKGTRVAAAAYIAPDGTEYTGPSHLAAMEQAKNEGKITQAEIDAKQAPESRETPQFGYKTDAEPFVTRDQAEGIARQSGQLLVDKPATGQLHSNEVALDEFPKAPAPVTTPATAEVLTPAAPAPTVKEGLTVQPPAAEPAGIAVGDEMQAKIAALKQGWADRLAAIPAKNKRQKADAEAIIWNKQSSLDPVERQAAEEFFSERKVIEEKVATIKAENPVLDPIGYGNALINLFPNLKSLGVKVITMEESLARLEKQWDEKQKSGKATRLDQLVYLTNKKNTENAIAGDSIGGTWTRQDLTVAVSSKATPSAMAHEIGHAIMELEFDNADQNTKNAITAEYTKWYNTKYGKEGTPSVADQRRIWEWMGDSDWLDPKAPFPEELRVASWERYRSSFKEWFADEVAKWATTREKPKSLIEKFFSELAAKLSKLWNAVSENFAPNETLATWLDSITKVSPSKVSTPVSIGIAVGNRVKTKTTPQSYVVEEVLPQSAREAELGEQYYRIKNERTGESQTVESNDIKIVKGKGVRKMAAEIRVEEDAPSIPKAEQYTYDDASNAAAKFFGGVTPENLVIVNDVVDPDFKFKASYDPNTGQIQINLAYIRKGENIEDIITHELGHFIYSDPQFQEAFQNFWNTLSDQDQAAINDLVNASYSNETMQTQIEERQVIAFASLVKQNRETANAWDRVKDTIKAWLNRVFGTNIALSDQGAMAVMSSAFKKFKSGKQVVREMQSGVLRMAAEPAPKRRKEQVGGAEREETKYITTPKGILSMNTDVLREKFFDGTSVSPEKTTQAWGYISRLLDIKSGNANEFAGEINDTVDADLLAKREAAIAAGEKVDLEEDVSKRIGAAMFSVELMNYAGRLAEQGDTRMLKFMIRNVNSMPTDKYAGDISDAARALRTRLEYDVSGFSAYTTEQKAKVDRTAAVMFGTDKPSKEQIDAVKDAIDESEKTELGNAGEVAGEVEKVEKRTKRKITDKIEKVIGKGSLKGMVQAIKDTPLEKQQERGWIEKVVNDYLINAGLSPEAASTASKLYESLIAERFAAAKQKAFEDNLKKAAPWKNYAARNSRLAKDALNKVQAAIRTGVLDPEKNTESIIAADSGWSGFTKDQYQRIVQLDSIINDPKQDDVTRREAMADLNKVISDAKLPVRFKDALGAYYVGNALMGIPTLTVNIASPIGFTVRNLMTDVSKYAFTDPSRIPVAFETFMESMRSWYDQTSYAFKNQIYLNDVVEYLQGQNVLRELFDKGKKQWAQGKYAEGFVNMAVGMTQITGRVLSSLDQGAISMLENQNITRYALEALANAKGKVPKDKLKEFANMVIDTRRKTIAENIANGMSRDRAGVLADLAVKSEVISALAQYDVNPMNVLDASINDALQSVGRNKTLTIKGIEQSQKNLSDEGFMSYWPIKLLEMVSAGAGREGSSMQIFAKMLYGFALVPARVFHNVAWFSPYGFIRLGIDKYKKNKGEDSPYAMSLQTDAQYKQRLTETIAGSIAMLGLAALSSASSDEDDDKRFKIVITGNGPNATTDKQYFDSWMKKWKPYSVHIVVNGNIIPINIGRGGEALFFPIMLAGALDDWKIKQKQNLTKKEPEDLSAIAQMLGSSFFALAQRGPYAAFTKPLFDASKDGRVTEELASQAGFFGKTFIPVVGSSLARNISDLFSDPIDRSSIEGAIYANTPVVGPWLGTKALNALGQPIRADDWGDRLFKLGVPVVFSFPKDTPMNELNELILKQGSGPTIPTRANAQKRFGDIITDKEFETYVREYGRVMSDKMFKNRTRLANLKPADYDDELEKYARGYSIDGIKIKGASDSAVLAVKRMRQ